MVRAPQPVALLGRVIAKYRELDRRDVDPRQFEARVQGRALIALRGERLFVAGHEIASDFRAFFRALDPDEPPGLAVADRRRDLREIEQGLEQVLGDGIGAKAANVAPPAHQFGKLRTELRAEDRFLLHHHTFATQWKKPPETNPRREPDGAGAPP